MNNNYHRNRAQIVRKSNWNYAWKGDYFITICTRKNENYFGDIQNNTIHLSSIGQILKTELLATPKIRADMNLTLGPFVIMPNHVHIVISIGTNKYNSFHNPTPPKQNNAMEIPSQCGDGHEASCPYGIVSTPTLQEMSTPALQEMSTSTFQTFGSQSKNLPAIIRGLKSSVTIQAKRINPAFKWHQRYHDHIIKNPQSYNQISDYIKNNINKWEFDHFNNKTK